MKPRSCELNRVDGIDELRAWTAPHQHRLDADYLCRTASHDSILHHLQRVRHRRPVLLLPLANLVLFECVG